MRTAGVPGASESARRKLFGNMVQFHHPQHRIQRGSGAVGTVGRRVRSAVRVLAVLFFLKIDCHIPSNPTNPGSDWTVLKALAFDG